MSKQCHVCGEVWTEKRSPGFRETCLQCNADLYCCKNCRFYDAQAYEWCREPQARQAKPRDPEASNTCDWFVFGETKQTGDDRAAKAKDELYALFGQAPSDEPEKPPDWQQVTPDDKPSLDDLFKS